MSLKMDEADGETLVRLVDESLASGSWLVLAAHDVLGASNVRDLDPTQGVEATHLDLLCAYARSRADVLWTDTVAAISAHLDSTRVRSG